MEAAGILQGRLRSGSTGGGEQLGRKATWARGALDCETCRSGPCVLAPGPCTRPPPTAVAATWRQQAPAAQRTLMGAEGTDSTQTLAHNTVHFFFPNTETKWTSSQVTTKP